MTGWPGVKSIQYLPRRKVLLLTSAGLISGLSVTLLVSALDRAPVVVVTPIVALNPIVSLTLVYFFLRRLEKVTKRVVLGTGIALIGAIFVIVGSTGL
jgi:drug/metabolite transporter (DMT)-like permease